jgi:hypothetical protein
VATGGDGGGADFSEFARSARAGEHEHRSSCDAADNNSASFDFTDCNGADFGFTSCNPAANCSAGSDQFSTGSSSASGRDSRDNGAYCNDRSA